MVIVVMKGKSVLVMIAAEEKVVYYLRGCIWVRMRGLRVVDDIGCVGRS